MSKALKSFNTKQTPQNLRADAEQVKNNAGGFSFVVSEWDRLERFLNIGTDGGTYYVGEVDLTQQNVDFVKKLLTKDAAEVIRRTVDVSDKGRAKSNSPALFVLALAMNTKNVDRDMIKQAVLKVARTFTHLSEYAMYLENLGGWGRAKRNSVAGWYTAKSDMALANQMIKYRNRNGFTHRDLMRLSHVKGVSNGLANFALGKEFAANEVPSLIIGYEKAQHAKTAEQIVSLVQEYGLPWEALPTEWLKNVKVWRALFEAGMGQTALVRNVTRFARLGAFDDLKFAAEYATKLSDPEAIEKGRMHPISYLNASIVFSDGQIDRNRYTWAGAARNKNWETNSKVLKALQNGFYAAFKNVEPADKRTLIGLDISGSMASAAMGLDLSCAQVGAAVAMQIARTEPYSETRGFSTSFIDLGITEDDSFSEALRKVSNKNFGGTDCSLPMVHAMRKKQEIDTFVVITDSETWAGRVHPHQALKDYRNKLGINARLAVLGVAGDRFTIADPKDAGQMDFVGFDSNGPKALADFSAGRL